MIDPDVMLVLTSAVPQATAGLLQDDTDRVEVWSGTVGIPLIPPAQGLPGSPTITGRPLPVTLRSAGGASFLTLGHFEGVSLAAPYLAGRFTAPVQDACNILNRARATGAVAITSPPGWDTVDRYNRGEAFTPGYFGPPPPPNYPAELYLTYATNAGPGTGPGLFSLRVWYGQGFLYLEWPLPPLPLPLSAFWPFRASRGPNYAALLGGFVASDYRHAARIALGDHAPTALIDDFKATFGWVVG